jgi:hypothetical protein
MFIKLEGDKGLIARSTSLLRADDRSRGGGVLTIMVTETVRRNNDEGKRRERCLE